MLGYPCTLPDRVPPVSILDDLMLVGLSLAALDGVRFAKTKPH